MDEAEERRAIIRALFAALAMHAHVSRHGIGLGMETDAVEASFKLADEMVKAANL